MKETRELWNGVKVGEKQAAIDVNRLDSWASCMHTILSLFLHVAPKLATRFGIDDVKS